MLADDMSVFFADGDQIILRRPAVPDVPFTGNLGVQSKEGLQGYAMAAKRELCYPAGGPDLRDGDELLHGTKRYRVQGDPLPQNDGQEMLAQLSEIRS